VRVGVVCPPPAAIAIGILCSDVVRAAKKQPDDDDERFHVTTDYRLPTTDYRLPTTDYGVMIAVTVVR